MNDGNSGDSTKRGVRMKKKNDIPEGVDAGGSTSIDSATMKVGDRHGPNAKKGPGSRKQSRSDDDDGFGRTKPASLE